MLMHRAAVSVLELKIIAKKMEGGVMDRQNIVKKLKQCKKIKYSIPWSSYRRLSVKDRNMFSSVLNVWQPEKEARVVLLRWLVTTWCSYSCPYCNQTHDRYAPKGKYTAHAFDNFSLPEWIEAFMRHFSKKRLSLVMTGGEPMLDRKNMVPLLKTLTNMPNVECVRIDTNASWSPLPYKEIDKSKIILMTTYHPSGTTESSFVGRIDQYLENGIKVGMVNYVITKSLNMKAYNSFKNQLLNRGIPLHPNPLWNSKGLYSKEDMDIFKHELPLDDYLYRSQLMRPRGKKCLFPAVAYEMDQTGKIFVGCHPHVVGSIFDQDLVNQFIGPVPCPSKKCVCLDKYSFLHEINRNITCNPLEIYSDLLISKQSQTQ
jgi:organic radical activating enzyme